MRQGSTPARYPALAGWDGLVPVAGLMVSAALILCPVTAGQASEPVSPLECGLKQAGLKIHIECVVTRDNVTIKQVIANDGACLTQQDYYDAHPAELDKWVKSTGLPARTLQHRKTYRTGQTFTIYMMPCNLGTYRIETNLGGWTWLAQRM